LRIRVRVRARVRARVRVRVRVRDRVIIRIIIITTTTIIIIKIIIITTIIIIIIIITIIIKLLWSSDSKYLVQTSLLVQTLSCFSQSHCTPHYYPSYKCFRCLIVCTRAYTFFSPLKKVDTLISSLNKDPYDDFSIAAGLYTDSIIEGGLKAHF
jgi:hypothetical protein